MMESRWGVKDSGVITDAITIKLRQSRQAAAMDGVIKIVQGCSGSTNVPHVPQQINAGSCMAPREKKKSEAEESQE
jgi:hypothetical protein